MFTSFLPASVRLAPLLAILLALWWLAPGAQAAARVQEVTADGVTAWLIEDHSLPMVSMRFTFRQAGSAYAADTPPGLPNFAMRMLTEGAGDLSSEAYNAALQDRAIVLGFDVDHDHASASLDALSEQVEEGLRLMALALSSPRLEKDDLARVREELLTGLRLQRQQPGYLANELFRRSVYGRHPYATPLYGTEESLKQVTAAGIRQYVSRFLQRDRLIISVAGDITPQRLQSLLKAHLSALPAGDGKPTALAKTELPQQTEPLIEKAPFPQAVAVFATPGLARNDPDFYAAYLMNHMLGGGGLESRLIDEVRRKRGLTYLVYSGLVMDDASELLRGGLATRGDQAKEAVKVVRATFRAAYEQGFTAAELERAKRYITGSFPLDIDANGELVNYLTVMQLKQLGPDYLEKRNAIMQAVTLEDVNRVAKRLLNPDKLYVAAIGEIP